MKLLLAFLGSDIEASIGHIDHCRFGTILCIEEAPRPFDGLNYVSYIDAYLIESTKIWDVTSRTIDKNRAT